MGADFRQIFVGGVRGAQVEKPSNFPHGTMWVMMYNLPARKTFLGKSVYFLQGQIAGQWLSSKLFPNFTPKSECDIVSPREPCFHEGSPRDPQETSPKVHKD